MEDYTPVDATDPLAADTLFEKIVWQGSIWIVYSAFIMLFIVSLVS